MFKHVSVSRHAVERFRQRFPAEAAGALSSRELESLIAFEVQAAHDDGRVATKKRPEFSYGAVRGKKRCRERFAWIEGAARGYVLAREHGGVVVVTTLSPRSQAAIAA